MWFHTRCDLSFEIAEATPFMLMLRPRRGPGQWVAREEYRLSPSVPVSEFADVYGNYCQRLIAPPGEFSIHAVADVMIPDEIVAAPGAPFVPVQCLPDSVLGFLLPSRYCESDRFFNMASDITEGHTLGYDQVAAIENWLRRSIRYLPGTSAGPESAVEVNLRGSGVCRDLSHLGIALCRSLSIPARMVVGYLYNLEPIDMHAWFEAYVGDRWYTFDATQDTRRGGYIVVGYGRDAADVAIFNQFGAPAAQTGHHIQVERSSGPAC